MSAEVYKVVENCHLFSGLDPGLISQVAASATRKTLGCNEFLFQKGDRADALWGVLSGRIATQVSTDDGKELVLDTLISRRIAGDYRDTGRHSVIYITGPTGQKVDHARQRLY
jgi:CRP-like cAMP-binding protein